MVNISFKMVDYFSALTKYISSKVIKACFSLCCKIRELNYQQLLFSSVYTHPGLQTMSTGRKSGPNCDFSAYEEYHSQSSEMNHEWPLPPLPSPLLPIPALLFFLPSCCLWQVISRPTPLVLYLKNISFCHQNSRLSVPWARLNRRQKSFVPRSVKVL